jgi:hypothetical protein
MKSLVVIILLAIACIFGPGIVEQLWPVANVSSTTRAYIGQDPNLSKFPFTTIGDLKKTKQAVEVQFFVSELELQSALKKNEGLHSIVAEEVAANLQAGEQQFQTVVGTKENPGWLGTILFGALSAVAVKYHSNATMYTEEEYQQAKNGSASTAHSTGSVASA